MQRAMLFFVVIVLAAFTGEAARYDTMQLKPSASLPVIAGPGLVCHPPQDTQDASCPQGCAECDTRGWCTTCVAGYFFAFDGTCKKCATGCAHCNDLGICKCCKVGDKFFESNVGVCGTTIGLVPEQPELAPVPEHGKPEAYAPMPWNTQVPVPSEPDFVPSWEPETAPSPQAETPEGPEGPEAEGPEGPEAEESEGPEAEGPEAEGPDAYGPARTPARAPHSSKPKRCCSNILVEGSNTPIQVPSCKKHVCALCLYDPKLDKTSCKENVDGSLLLLTSEAENDPGILQQLSEAGVPEPHG